jgi:type IV secretory pathway protease TraF
LGIENSKAFRIAVIGAIAGAIAWAEPHIRVVGEKSVRYSVLWEVGGPVAKGDYVDVPMPAQFVRPNASGLKGFFMGPNPRLFTKRVGCMGGEILRAANGGHYCGDVWLGSALRYGSDGKPLHMFEWNGPVPYGKVFLTGDNPRSYDSRYLGFFEQSEAIRLKGLW